MDEKVSGAPHGADADVVDVAEFIDRQPVGRFQIGLLLTCAAVVFIDGFDTQAIGYVAPNLAGDLDLPRNALGPVFSAGLFGMMIGALVFSAVADRIGRKRIIVASCVTFGVFSLATVFAEDVSSLLVLRFLTGLGLGGAMPNAIALTSEFSPHRRRATMVMAMFCGFSVGAALGGLLAAALIPTFGWRSMFLIGGVVPLLAAPLLAYRLPESVRFLALKGDAHQEVAAMLSWISPAARFAPETRFGVSEARLAGFPVAHLFHEGRTLATLLFWVMFFMNLLDLYLLANWLPTVLNDLGASESAAAAIGSMLQVGGVIGTLMLGQFVDRFSFRALSLTYFFAAIAVAAIGYSGQYPAMVTVAVFCAGFCIVGGQMAANALAAIYYPTTIRSTGVGWALGIGRVGSIVGPLIGGVMLARNVGTDTLFLSAAVPAVIACLAAFALNRACARKRDGTGVRTVRLET